MPSYSDKWKRLYEKWRGDKSFFEKYKKHLTILAVGIAFVLVYWYLTRPTVKMGDFISVASSFESPLSGKLDTGSMPKNSCYWFRSLESGEKWKLEIWQMENTTNCTAGVLVNTTSLDMEYPINIRGDDCICSNSYPTISTDLKTVSGITFIEVTVKK